MPRLVGSSADGSADEVAELQCALQQVQDELTRVRHVVAQLEERLRLLEQQNEAAPRRQQERGVEGDVRDGFRVCRKSCGREFRVHRHHQHEHLCCSNCRKGMGHSERCAERSRPVGGAAANAWS